MTVKLNRQDIASLGDLWASVSNAWSKVLVKHGVPYAVHGDAHLDINMDAAHTSQIKATRKGEAHRYQSQALKALGQKIDPEVRQSIRKAFPPLVRGKRVRHGRGVLQVTDGKLSPDLGSITLYIAGRPQESVEGVSQVTESLKRALVTADMPGWEGVKIQAVWRSPKGSEPKRAIGSMRSDLKALGFKQEGWHKPSQIGFTDKALRKMGVSLPNKTLRFVYEPSSHRQALKVQSAVVKLNGHALVLYNAEDPDDTDMLRVYAFASRAPIEETREVDMTTFADFITNVRTFSESSDGGAAVHVEAEDKDPKDPAWKAVEMLKGAVAGHKGGNKAFYKMIAKEMEKVREMLSKKAEGIEWEGEELAEAIASIKPKDISTYKDNYRAAVADGMNLRPLGFMVKGPDMTEPMGRSDILREINLANNAMLMGLYKRRSYIVMATEFAMKDIVKVGLSARIIGCVYNVMSGEPPAMVWEMVPNFVGKRPEFRVEGVDPSGPMLSEGLEWENPDPQAKLLSYMGSGKTQVEFHLRIADLREYPREGRKVATASLREMVRALMSARGPWLAVQSVDINADKGRLDVLLTLEDESRIAAAEKKLERVLDRLARKSDSVGMLFFGFDGQSGQAPYVQSTELL